MRSLTRSGSSSSHPPAWWLFAVALGLTVLEGAFRKWLIGSEAGLKSYLVYFSKDIIFGSLLLLPPGFKTSPVAESFRLWLVPGCVLIIFGALLGSWFGKLNPAGAFLSIRALLLLPVLATLALNRLNGVPLRYSAALLALLAIINFALSSFQNQLPADHILNRYVVADADIVTERSGVRATGTFSFITGLSLMSSVGVWAGLVLISIGTTKTMRTLGTITVVSGCGCALASISRAPLVLAVVMVVGWVFLSRSARSRIWSTAGVLGLVIALVMGSGAGARLKVLWDGLAARNNMASDSAADRAFGQFVEAWQAVAFAPVGRGLGTEQVGGNYAATGTMQFTNYETQFPRIVMETGIIGFVGFLVVCWGALSTLQKARAETNDPGGKDAILITQLLLATLFYTNVIFNHTASAFAWMLFTAVLAGINPPSMPQPLIYGPKQKIGRRFRRSSFAPGRGDDGARPAATRSVAATAHSVDLHSL